MPRARSKTLTKRQLVDRLSRKSVASKREVEQILRLFLDAIFTALKDGDEVRIIPFGTFAVKTRKARRARNPRTGQPLFVPETRVPVFRPGKLLRQALR